MWKDRPDLLHRPYEQPRPDVDLALVLRTCSSGTSRKASVDAAVLLFSLILTEAQLEARRTNTSAEGGSTLVMRGPRDVTVAAYTRVPPPFASLPSLVNG